MGYQIRKNLFWLMALLPLIFSCNNLKTAAPEETMLDTLLQPPVSVIVVPVNFRLSDIQALINEKIQGTVLRKWIMIGDNGDSLYLEISKSSEIKVNRKDRTLYYNVPAIITGHYRAKIAGLKIKNTTPVRANVVLHMASAFHMGKKWNLISKTRILSIEWKEEPTVKVGMFKINLKSVLQKMLEEKESELTTKADETLQRLINTRKIVQKLWLDIQKPIVINKKKIKVMLQARCIDITGRLMDSDPEMLGLEFELKTEAHTYIEGDVLPPPNPDLPDFRQKTNEKDSLLVNIHSLVKFSVINKLINEELAGTKISQKGLEVTIKKIRVYGTPKGIAVELKVDGDISGFLYAQGEPKFDSSSKVIAVKNLEFNLDTKNVIAQSADWFLHTNILDLIAGKLEFNTVTLADKLPELIMRGVEKGKTGQKIDIHVGQLDVWPQKMITTRGDIQLLVKATGKVSVFLEQKVFEGKKKQ